MFLKNAHLKALSVLVSGTAIAQALPVAASPILTRLFSPEDFGRFATFTAVSSVLAVAITGRYELAVTSPSDRREAAGLVVLASWLAIIIALMLSVAGWASLTIASVCGWDLSGEAYLIYSPIAAACVASLSIGQIWYNRSESWRTISTNRVTAAIAITASGILFGLLRLPGGLITGYVLGQAIAAVWLYRRLYKDTCRGNEAASLWPSFGLAAAYRNQPFHIAPAHLVGTIAFQLPVFILSHSYSEDDAGQFALAYRTITLPTVLVATAMGEVYRSQISRRVISGRAFHDIYLATLKYTSIIGIGAGLLGYMTSEKLFSIVFGSSWVVAGSYARILSIATAFQFALTPLDKGAIVLGKSHYVLVWNGLRLACLLGLGLFARAAKPSVETVLWTLAIINIMLYSLDAIIGYGFAKLGQVQDSGKSDQLKLQTPA